MAGTQGKLRALEEQEEQRRLSKEELLRPRKLRQEVEIEGLGGKVEIQTLSYQKRRELKAEAKAGTAEYDDDLFTLLVISESVVDPKLTRGDLEALGEQDGMVLDTLSVEVAKLNLMGKAEELKKDSSETSNSDSP